MYNINSAEYSLFYTLPTYRQPYMGYTRWDKVNTHYSTLQKQNIRRT